MPDIKISQLALNTTPTGSIEFEVNNSGVSEKVSLASILAGITADYQSADNANAANITDLQTDRAQLVSPTFTGTVTVPTPAVGGAATTKTYVDTADDLRLTKTGGTMTGAIAMSTNKITGLGDGTTATQDAATVIQMEAANILKPGTLQDYDPTATSAFPTTWNAIAIKKGNRFYITVAGTMVAGTVVVAIGDVIEARINAAGNIAADWSVIQANTVQATTTVSGIMETATDAETLAATSILAAVTPSNLASFLATETQIGVREIASQAETDAETNDITFITPLKLGAKAATDYQQFIGLTSIINKSAGTWTKTRIAQGDYVERLTSGVTTAIIGIDITREFRTASLRGYKLNSIDTIWKNDIAAGADLTANSITLDRISYTNNGLVTVTNIPLTGGGTLLFTQQANPFVQSKEITTPAYFTQGDHYIAEITITTAAASDYDFYGLRLRFSRTIN